MHKDEFYRLRFNMNLTQDKLAEILGLSRQTIQKYETGKTYIKPVTGYAMRHLYDYGPQDEDALDLSVDLK